MARDLTPKHKACRRFGEKLCDSPKCPVMRRNYPTGEHGQARKRSKVSGYGRQLLEKQKAKQIYGLLERQFANYVAEAAKKTGDTSKILLTYLESRLDNVVYRMGLAKSRRAARRLVTHGHIAVNGKKLDIPSYRVRVTEVVSAGTTAKQKHKLFQTIAEELGQLDTVPWLALEAKNLSAKVLNTPTVERPLFDAKSIIEFYSR